MKNKLLALLSFILLTTPLAAQQSGGFTYTSDGSAITITGYAGPGGAVIIPTTIAGLPVTAIGPFAFGAWRGLTGITIPGSIRSIGIYAFDYCISLTNVTILNGVTRIGDHAFDNCTSLTGLTIPDSVTSIGQQAFEYCYSLANVEIPGSVTNIGQEAFENCYSLTNVTILNGVINVGDYAFYNCTHLTGVTIPGSVTNIGIDAFSACSSLVALTVEPSNSSYSSSDGALFDKSQTTMIECPEGKTGSYVIPNSVTTIGDGAFEGCYNLTNVTIPGSVTNIGDYAFRNCINLTNITMPGSVSSIGIYAFDYCTSLANVTIANGLTNISDHAFEYCFNLTNITIPGSVNSIGDSAFYRCISLTSITIPASVSSIGSNAFYNCTGLVAITVDVANASYSSLDGVLFNKSQTTLIQCPETKAGTYVIPGTVTTIGVQAFSACTSLTDVTIPGSVTYIGVDAFASCLNLISVTIPSSVTNIGRFAFENCPRLTRAFFEGNAPTYDWYVFGSSGCLPECYPPTIVYYLPGTTGWGERLGDAATRLWNPLVQFSGPGFGVGPAGFSFNITGSADIPIVVEASTNLASGTWTPLQSFNLTNGAFYFSDPNWVHYPNRFYRIRTTQQSADFTYTSDGSAITITGYTGPGGPVTIPATIAGLPVTAIGSYAFSTWRGLSSLIIPNGVTNIGDYAFYNCDGLSDVAIPGSVRSIGTNAFDHCTSLVVISVDAANASYSSLDGVLFNKSQTTLLQCPKGKSGSYVIPGTVTTIGDAAFEGCYNLTSVTIPGSVTSIGLQAFWACDGLNSVMISSGVINIGDYAFGYCASLAGVTIPGSVTTIGDYAFEYCNNLANVTILNGVTNIGDYAFAYCSSLTNITIPGSVTSIPTHAFSVCGSLVAITVDADNGSYSSLDGTLFDKSQTRLIHCPNGKAGIYVIPGGVTSIGDSAFSSCYSLTHVTIPNGVTTIGAYAFVTCIRLTGVTLTDSVTTIGDHAFEDCGSLTNITIPGSVTTIGDYAFSHSLAEITVDAANAFYSSSDGVLFNKSQTTLIQCPGRKTGNYSIPGTVTAIGVQAFSSCNLNSVTIPGSVTNIGALAFDGCIRLTSVTIPRSVTSIGANAFYNCTSLQGVFFMGNTPSIAGDIFAAVFGPGPATVYYLPGATGWGATFADRPAILWNPLMQTSGPSFGVGAAGFGFNITGTADIPIVVEAATNLANASWVPLQSLNVTNGAVYFSDPNWTNYPARTYRIRSP